LDVRHHEADGETDAETGPRARGEGLLP
jgi:hypothetical protein